MTFLELCQQVRQQSGVSGTGPLTVAGQVEMLGKIVSWVSQVEQKICNMKDDWSFLWRIGTVTILAGQTIYSPQALGVLDLKRVVSLKASGRKLTELDYRRFSERGFNRPSPTAETPAYFCIRPDLQFVFYPTPAADLLLEVEYYRQAPVLRLDSDQSPIPEQYQQMIVDAALMRYAMHDEDGNLFADSEQRYQQALTELSNRYLPHLKIGGSDGY